MARPSAGVATPTGAPALVTPSLSLLQRLLLVLCLSASCVEVSGDGPADVISTRASKKAAGDLISPLATYDLLDLPRNDGFSPSLDVLGFQSLPDDYSKPPPDLISFDPHLSSPPPSLIPSYVSSALPSSSPISSHVVSPSSSSASFPSDVSTPCSTSLTPWNEPSASSSSDVFGAVTTAPTVNSPHSPSKITHSDTLEATALPNITTSASLDSAKSASEASVPEGGEEVESEPYDLARGPLSCSDVWPLLRKKDKGRCSYRWAAGAEYPEVLCELIGGYKPIAGSFTTLIHNAATYQVTSTRVGDAPGPAGGWCAFQTRFELRKVDALPAGVPVSADEALLQAAQSERGAHRREGDTLLALVSQVTAASKASVSSLTHPQPNDTCKPEVWVIAYTKRVGVVDLYFNRAWRVIMEFNPAYMTLANFLLGYLREGAAVEELEVHGGERWDGADILPVALRRLRALDFSRNGLTSFGTVNFERMPNLQHLNLSYNNLASVPGGVSLLRGLRVLDLSHNPLAAPRLMPALRPLLQLRVLNLSGTPLPGLDPLVPREEPLEPPTAAGRALYPQLEVLDVSTCNISDVASAGARCLLRKARRLHTLRLANNPLAAVPSDFVEQLPSLQVLDLSGCRLTQPPGLRLWPGARLQLLDLSRNALSSPAGALSAQGGGAALLDVSGNPLRGEWGAHAFAALGPRAAVNLSRTELTALTATMLRALRPLRLVDLGANPLDCAKCATRHLQQWLRNGTGEQARPSVGFGRTAAAAGGQQPTLPPVPARARLPPWIPHRAEHRGVHGAQPTHHHDPHARLRGQPGRLLTILTHPFVSGQLRSLALAKNPFLVLLTHAFVGSQWCQWELEMATHRLLEGAGRDFLVLVELQPLDAKALPRLLRLLVETRTFLQWPSGCAPGGCCGRGAEGAEEAAWRRLRAALGPPIRRSSRHGPSTPVLPKPALPPNLAPAIDDKATVAFVKDKDPPLIGGDFPSKNCIALDV
ncbi:Protein artichoke [Gryllus bimaculatus]|nr:Protein artichoke [Gryllus bimaculatus]